MATLNIPAAVSTITVRKSWAASNHALVQAYVDSLVEGIAFVKNNKEAALEIMQKYIKFNDPAAYEEAYDLYYAGANPIIPNDPFPRPGQFTDIVNRSRQSNASIKSYDLNNLLDPSFVQSAVDRGLAKWPTAGS